MDRIDTGAATSSDYQSHGPTTFRLRRKMEDVMAKNGARGGGRVGAVSKRSQVQNPRTGKWVKRDASTGRFMATKRTGGSFKGVRRER